MEQTVKELYCRMRNRLGSEFGTCKCTHPGQCEHGPTTEAERKRSRVHNLGIALKDQLDMIVKEGKL